METLRRAVRNVAAQLGSQAITWSATLLFMALLARHLGRDGFGVLFLSVSVTGLFGTVIDFGIHPLVTREVARDRERVRQYLVAGLILKAGLWAMSLVAIQLIALVLGYPAETRMVMTVLGLALALSAMSSLINAMYRGLEYMGPPAAAGAVEKVATLGLGAFVVVQGGSVVAVAWVMLAGAAAALVVQAVPFRRFVIGHTGPVPAAVRRLLMASAPFAAMAAVSQLYWRIDAVMLSTLADDAVVGSYGAAYRLFETLNFLPSIVASSVMLPVLARLSGESMQATRAAFAKGLDVLLVIGIPTCVGVIVLARPILLFVYGEGGFESAAPALRVLGVGLLVLYVNMAVTFTLISLDRERRLLLLPLGALALNVVLNLFLIPRWQESGAAVATTVSEAGLTIAYFTLLPRVLWPAESLRVATRATVAAGGMAIALLALHMLWLPLLVTIGGIVYVTLGLAIRMLPREDIDALIAAVRRRPVGEAFDPA